MHQTQTAAQDRQRTASSYGKFLCFLLDARHYGINILRVKEIIEYAEITPIPRMPDFLRGAINLRGRVVPVIDIARQFGLPGVEATRRTCIVIVELEINHTALDVGVLVDAVSQVTDIPEDEIEEAPSLGGQLETGFILGMARLQDRFVVLLNIDRILSLADLVVLKGATRQKGDLFFDTKPPYEADQDD